MSYLQEKVQDQKILDESLKVDSRNCQVHLQGVFDDFQVLPEHGTSHEVGAHRSTVIRTNPRMSRLQTENEAEEFASETYQAKTPREVQEPVYRIER